jgi:thiamine biosynthesis lipoprotein ApbE
VRTRLALIAVLFVIPLAGCGTSAKEQYRQDFQKVAQRFRASVEKAGAQVKNGATLQDRVPALRSFKASLDKLASDLGALDPPSELKRANADAVSQLHVLSSDLADYAHAAAADERSQATKIIPKLQADQTLLQKTLDQLDRQVSG